MYVTNVWGIFFCFYFPTLLAVYGAYRAGIEDGKRKYKKHKKAGGYKDGRKYRRSPKTIS